MKNTKISYLKIFLTIFLIEVIIEGFGYRDLGRWIYGRLWYSNNMVVGQGIHLVWMLIVTTPILYWWVIREFKAQRTYQNALTDKENEFYSLFSHNSDLVLAFDLNGYITNINPAVEKTLGYTREELIKTHRQVLVAPEKREESWEQFLRVLHGEPQDYENTLLHKNGHLIYIHARNIPIYKNGKIVGVYAIDADITEQKRHEERVWKLAHYDHLTQLPNRRLLIERLDIALETAQKNQGKLAVMFLDLDRFKQINDSLGHNVGDDVLRIVAQRIGECVRNQDMVARFGGDEFVLLLSDIKHMDEVKTTADRLLSAIHECIKFEGYEFFLTASIGIAIFPASGTSSKSLLINADMSMYEAKRKGKNTYQLHMPSANEHAYDKLQLENDLRKALKYTDELFLEYQPQVDVKSGDVVSAEALLRWNHSVLGRVAPNEFIPLAEETGLIIPLGQYVLENVCRQLAEWKAAGRTIVPISVNISALEIQREDFVEKLWSTIEEWNIPPEWIAIEITETTLLKNERETMEKIQAIREVGIKIFIDDFGRGYSSLGFLKNFPIDVLKVDQMFVRDIDINDDDASIVSALITLAHSRNLPVIAEGVERTQQLSVLHTCDCDEYQGYLFCHPIPAQSFAEKYLLEVNA